MADQERRCDVSIVMPLYNCEKTVEKAICSALSQTVSNIEIIVVDDCSKDQSAAVVERIAAKDGRVKLIKLPENLGVGGARKKALENVSGEFMTLLDADDWYLPDRIEHLLQAAKNLNADIVCDNLYLFDHALGRIVGKTEYGWKNKIRPLGGREVFDLDNAFCRHHLGTTQPIIRTSFIRKNNITYDTTYRCGEDFLFLSELILSGAKSYIIPYTGYVYIHRISPSARTVAPNSTADHGYEGILKSCDHLLEKYGNKMTKVERDALKKRKNSIIYWTIYNYDFLPSIHRKDYRKIFTLIRKYPFLWAIKFYTVRNRIQNLLMINSKNNVKYMQICSNICN